MSVAFDSAELRALNAVNIDCDITFMQVSRRFALVWPRVRLRVMRLCVMRLSQFLECLVAVANKLEKSDVVSVAVKVQLPLIRLSSRPPSSLRVCRWKR